MKYIFRKKYLSLTAGIVDAAGHALFRRRETKAPEPKTLLVVRLDHLGDVLGATGVPQSLKGHFSSARVVFLTSSAGKELLANNPYVDEVLVYDAPWFSRPGTSRSKTGFLETVRRLRALDIDLGLSLRGDARENLLLFLAGVRFRVGYGITGLGFLLHRELSYREEVPEAHHTLDILRALGVHRDTLLPSLFFSEEENSLAAAMAGEAHEKKLVGIQFDAGSPAKTWPEASRSGFLDSALKDLSSARLLFVGTDARLASWLESRSSGSGALNLVGKTSIRELLLRLKTCCCFVGPDSGPAHLAAALGVPTLFLYSGTNVFEKWRSAADNADYLRHPVPCAPCHRTECNVEGHPCMAGIAPEAVLRWLKERLRAD